MLWEIAMTVFRMVLMTAAIWISAPSLSYGQTSNTGVLKLPEDIVFRAPLALPGASPAAGIQSAVLYGNPTRPGLYVVRVKLSPGYRSPPHTHKEDYRGVTVLSGTLYFAISDVWDDSKLKAYPAGTFFTEPPDLAHYAAAKESEVVFELTGMGPTSTMPAVQRKN